MNNIGIPANAHNGVVAGENAKIVYVVYSTSVEPETTNIWGVYDNLESAKKHFAYLKEWIGEFDEDYEESQESLDDMDYYYEVDDDAGVCFLEIVEMKVKDSFNLNN